MSLPAESLPATSRSGESRSGESLPADNPFAAPSARPFGLPAFELIEEKHFLPAFEAGMAEQLAEVAAVVADPAEPTLANTVEALERSGRLLTRVSSVFHNLIGSVTTDGLRAIEAEVLPRLAAHRDAVRMDRGLFRRVDALYARRAELELRGERRRLLERYRTDLLRAGAALPAEHQQRLREINQELAQASADFRNRLQADSQELAVHLTDPAELAGLPPDAVEAAAAAARERGLSEGYLLTLVLPSVHPALPLLHDRSVRERLHRAQTSRGSRGNEHDTRTVLTRAVELRAERAGLLGFEHHAGYVVADETAGSVEAVCEMLTGLVGPTLQNVRAEAADLEAALVADGHAAPLRPWDWPYYAERRRRERFAVDAAALRPYFELDRVLERGVFAAAHALYGLTFTPRPDLPGYCPDVRVYQVTGPEGVPFGLVLTDWYARDSKRGGAWMNSFVQQSRLLDTAPVVVINLNIPRPPPGRPTLLTLDEVGTAFHEFGHVLHALLSDVCYPRFSGTNVPRDFVEFPSQVNEMWAWWPALIGDYAVHHETGEPLPADQLERLLAARNADQGFATAELLAAALLDQAWHRLAPGRPVPAPEEVASFERAALAEHKLLLEAVAPRYRSTYFAHIFSGGYSAGYYSYLWSEVLDADAADWFAENGGLSRYSGEVFRRELLSRGGAVDPMTAFAAVRGRPPRVEPLLKRRGLLPA